MDELVGRPIIDAKVGLLRCLFRALGRNGNGSTARRCPYTRTALSSNMPDHAHDISRFAMIARAEARIASGHLGRRGCSVQRVRALNRAFPEISCRSSLRDVVP
jgi:hypothetical protein